MRKSAIISFCIHAAIILAALFALPAPAPFKVAAPEPIQVDISAMISDKTQKMAMAKDAPDATPDPAPKKTDVTKDVPPAPKVDDKVNNAAHEPTAPPPPKQPDPKPVDKPLDSDPLKQIINDDQKKLEQQQQADEQAAIAEAQKKAEEDKKKADEKKKDDDAKKKAEQKKKLDQALADAQTQLNKIAGENTAPAKASDKTGTQAKGEKDQQGSDKANTATIAAALISRIKECFNIPAAARETNVSVPIHFLLNQDGSVNGQPEAVQDPGSDPIAGATTRAAISAIMECQNYELPADQYEQWKDNTIDFNPTQIAGQ